MNMNDTTDSRTMSSVYPVSNSERKSTVLQETPHNIMNRSPRGDKKFVGGGEQESRKRAAVSPIKSINEPVRRKLDKDVGIDWNDQEPAMVADVAAELDYQNWLLERRLEQTKEISEFLMMERQFSKLD
ncbi:predicted protein [Candida tropicalis MYA-3404]|uniref:Uncharacterized protein n=1 Tax=Candida tropicalis (strain ATCC MYA-3404 / T1) TaxID=294747 RepID=C5MAR5_CANTT|nr:predicted protein [Candida tropicalis MYA-3404]EER32732.1 predicted protein [Candida tropicalis MYA-3404]KAG4406558.1 hypothetical protein JTP64_003942 [Candida tropicalis]